MSLDPAAIAKRVTLETALDFVGRNGRPGESTIEISPAGHPPNQTFTIRCQLGWRSLEVRFVPGTFSGELVAAMGTADSVGRAAFSAVLNSAASDGAAVDVRLNGAALSQDSIELWQNSWSSFEFGFRKGQLPLQVGPPEEDEAIVSYWSAKLAAAVVALLPLEEIASTPDEVIGYPEGARLRIEVNRYERDRRNRAAALAIHGHRCQGCSTLLEEVYGAAAVGFIEVHHLSPVSTLGEGYVINPKLDLVPVCPNCHAIIHKRAPPYSLEELRHMIGSRRR